MVSLRQLAGRSSYRSSCCCKQAYISNFPLLLYNFFFRFDVTRVTFTVPLREHFSMPFLFLQLLVTGRYLAGRKFLSPTFQVLAIYSCSLLFCLFWQFAQFVFLLQALVLFCLATVGLLDRDKVINVSSLVFTFILMQVSHVLAIYWCSLLSVWYLQFYQPMLVTSLVVSFIPVAILSVQVSFFNMSNCIIFGLSKR